MTPIAQTPFTFRVLTVNIHKGFTSFNRRFVLPELREALRGVGAEVVALQEVHGAFDAAEALAAGTGSGKEALTAGQRWPDTPHYEFMADKLWPEHAYGRNAVYPRGDHGNAVLSRYPIEHWCNHDVTHTSDQEPRGILHCRLRIPGLEKVVHMVCVHLGLRERARQQQIQRLGDLVAAHVPADAPLVIAGDFNDWRGKARRAMERMGLKEAHAARKSHPPRTFPASFPLLRLDRIYVRGVRRCVPLALPRRPWNRLSDHAPLAAQIEI